jgi:hypothetical protein
MSRRTKTTGSRRDAPTPPQNDVTWREYLDARLAVFETKIGGIQKVLYIGFAGLFARIYGPDFERFFERGGTVVKEAAVCVARACGLS